MGGSRVFEKLTSTSLLALAIMAMPAAAHVAEAAENAAADAAAATTVEDSMMIVTANKRLERQVDVAAAVTAVSGEALLRRNLPQIEDVAAQIPGLSIQQVGNRATRVILRGLNSGGNGATVATLLDDAPLSYSGSNANGAIDIANFDTYDLNRIEVLRGPQGTLYGATAEGGLIKYVTNAPDLNTVSGGAEGIVETTEEGGTGWTGRAFINIPLINDKLALRASGFYKDVQGYIDNRRLGISEVNNGRRYGGRIQLLIQPSDSLSIKLGALLQDQHFNDNGNLEVVGTPLTGYTAPTATTDGTATPDSAFAIANSGRLQSNNFLLANSDNRSYLFTGSINWSLGFADFLSATSYGGIRSTFGGDSTSALLAPGVTFQDFFGGALASFGITPPPPFDFNRQILISQRQANALVKFNQEFRLSSKPGLKILGFNVDWQAGVFIARENTRFDQFFDFLETDRTLITSGVPGGTTFPSFYHEFSVFGSVKLHLSDRLSVEGGGRWGRNFQDLNTTTFRGFLFPQATPVQNTPTPTFSESNFTWSVAPQFKINDDTSVYARFATGYRPGGPTLPVPGLPPGIVLPTFFKSDSTINYEIGFKGSLFDRKLSIDVAAFLIDWTDIQVLSAFRSSETSPTFNIAGNAATARSKGFEWNVALTPLSGLTISDVGAYTDARLTQDALPLGGRNGSRLPYVPQFANTVNIDYRMKLNDGTSGFIGGTWSYTSNRSNGFSSSPTAFGGAFLPSYSTFNAQAGFERGHIQAEIFVRNLTDTRALTTYGSSGGANLTGFAQILQPRTIGLKLGVKY